MASHKISQALAEAQAKGVDEQATALGELLTHIETLAPPASPASPAQLAEDLTAVADALFAGGLRLVAQRGLIERLVAVLAATANSALQLRVGQHLLALLAAQQQAATFPDQDARLRMLLADAYEDTHDFVAVATVLAAVNLDPAQRKVSDHDRVATWLRIVRAYLEADDATAATAYLNKVKALIHAVPDPVLTLYFRLSHARIQDANRDFLSASHAYHALSFDPQILDAERLHILAVAARCAILAPAGPPRARALARLYKDDRVHALDEAAMLESMFLDRLITPAEVDRFALALAPHQKATTHDGSTVLARAVLEHNLLAVSRLFTNVGFRALARLLALDPARAEHTTARMIEQGRLVGRIDQIRELIWFERDDPSPDKRAGRADPAVGREMRRWDANVQGLADDVENVTNALQTEFPDFVAANLVV